MGQVCLPENYMHKFDTKCLYSLSYWQTQPSSLLAKAKQFAVTTSTGLYMTKSTNVHNSMYWENRQLVVAWEAEFFYFPPFCDVAEVAIINKMI